MFGGIPAGLLIDYARSTGAYYQQELPLDTPPFVFVKPDHLVMISECLSIYSPTRHGIMGTVDHPSFHKTREWLSTNGYIEKANSSNADRVQKPFYFNNVYLDVDDTFYCSAAMGNSKKYKEFYNEGKPLYNTPNYKKEEKYE